MFKRIIWLTMVLMCLCAAATADTVLPDGLTEIAAEAFLGDASLTGLVTLPGGVESVGDAAFAETDLYALRVPAGCSALGADVLRGTNAAYLCLEGASTAIDTAALGAVPYVFAPEGSPAEALGGSFIPLSSMLMSDGFCYQLTDDGVFPLCPVDGTALPAEVTLPDDVFGWPLLALDSLIMPGCEDVLLTVPCLPIPSGLNARYDCNLTVTAITAQNAIVTGSPVTFQAEVSGEDAVSYKWTIQHGEKIQQETTTKPLFAFTPQAEADIKVTVTATDAVGHTALMTVNFAYPMGATPVVYRALLVGNTYTGASNVLPGCDTDVNALATVLSGMPGSDYRVTRRYDLTASAILTEIQSAFSGADENDVSLFHFSGHGTSSGYLVGTGETYLPPSKLRSVLDTIPGTKVILLDCCYSGKAIGKAGTAGSPAAFNSAVISAFAGISRGPSDLADRGYQVITACRGDQESNSLTDGTTKLSFGAFTYSLCYGSGYDEWHQIPVEGLPADTDANGAITLGESRNFIAERIAWLNTLVTPPMDQSVQYHGDSDFIMWYR